MLVRRCLTLPLPVLLLLTALALLAGPAAAPASAGMILGNVYDKFGNPLGGILVEAIDADTGTSLGSGSTSAGMGDFGVEILTPANGLFKVRVSDPAGIFTTAYLYDSPVWETAELIGYS